MLEQQRQTSTLDLRELRADEFADDAPRKSSHLRCVQPQDGVSPPAFFDHNQAAIRDELAAQGALLFRDFGIDSVKQAEELVRSLGVTMDVSYLGGASPRSSLSDYMFTSTEAPPRYIISFHTEMCYLRQRPRSIIFFCHTEPQQYGETPLFDCAGIYERLPDDLRDRIETQGLMYERHFGKKTGFMNVYKSWSEAFHSDDPDEVEASCRQQGLEYRWTDKGELVTHTWMPGFMDHPLTGKRCISLTLYNPYAVGCDIGHFRHRFNPLVRWGLSATARFMFGRKKVFLRTRWGNGDWITQQDTQRLIDAAWGASTVFKWQRGDLLLLDNIRTGHGRLNVQQPRLIAAGLGDCYDVESLHPDERLQTVA